MTRYLHNRVLRFLNKQINATALFCCSNQKVGALFHFPYFLLNVKGGKHFAQFWYGTQNCLLHFYAHFSTHLYIISVCMIANLQFQLQFSGWFYSEGGIGFWDTCSVFFPRRWAEASNVKAWRITHDELLGICKMFLEKIVSYVSLKSENK